MAMWTIRNIGLRRNRLGVGTEAGSSECRNQAKYRNGETTRSGGGHRIVEFSMRKEQVSANARTIAPPAPWHLLVVGPGRERGSSLGRAIISVLIARPQDGWKSRP